MKGVRPPQVEQVVAELMQLAQLLSHGRQSVPSQKALAAQPLTHAPAVLRVKPAEQLVQLSLAEQLSQPVGQAVQLAGPAEKEPVGHAPS